MKYGWVVLLLVAGVITPRVSQAQVEVYAEGSLSDLQNGPQGNYLYGVSTGVLIEGPNLGKHFLLSGDIQGRFVDKNGEKLDGITVGPRFSWLVHRWGLTPYAEFMVGDARYNDSQGNVTTDNTFQVNAGANRQIKPRWDVMVDYSYAQYGALNGKYNPKTYSVGLVYHFVKR